MGTEPYYFLQLIVRGPKIASVRHDWGHLRPLVMNLLNRLADCKYRPVYDV